MSATEVHSPSRDAAAGKADMPLEVEIIPVSDAGRSRQFYQRLGWGEGRPVVAAVFGPDGQRVLALIDPDPGPDRRPGGPGDRRVETRRPPAVALTPGQST